MACAVKIFLICIYRCGNVGKVIKYFKMLIAIMYRSNSLVRDVHSTLQYLQLGAHI